MREHQALQRHFQLWHLILALLCALLPSTGWAQEGKPRVLLVPYHVGAGVDLDAETANAILVARMSKVPIFHIISQEEIARMANFQATLQGLGEDDTAGLVELGKMVHADRLVFGSLGDVGGTVAATLTILNVHTGDVEKRVAGTARGQRDLIIPLLNGQADALLAHLIKSYAPEKMRTAPTPPPPPPVAESAPRMPWMVVVGSVALTGLGMGLGIGITALVSMVAVGAGIPGAAQSPDGRVVMAALGALSAVGLVAALAGGLVLGGTVAARATSH